MIFTLEALNARHGDALLLHYGDAAAPNLMVIDGGPSGIFRAAVRPRLEALHAERGDKILPISLLMVSHMDDDHIHGVLDLTRYLADLEKEKKPQPWRIKALWHNTFDEVVGNVDPLSQALSAAVAPMALGGPLPPGLGMDRYSALVVASVAQGRQLRDDARALRVPVNAPWRGRVVSSPLTATLDGGLSLTVLLPARSEVESLQKEWDQNRDRMKKATAEAQAIAAAFVDKSVFSLSSIAVLASLGERRMLLTGDARGDFLLHGLEAAGLLSNGTIHVDLLKVPHHGSQRNVDPDFFGRVTADHYVISADGRHDNPDPKMLKMLTEARGADEYAMYFTNRVPAVEAFFGHDRSRRRRYEVVYRADDGLSVSVPLLNGARVESTPRAERRRRPMPKRSAPLPVEVEVTPEAPSSMSPLDLAVLAFRLVVARHAAPATLLHLDLNAILDAARTAAPQTRTAADLVELKRTLEDRQRGIAPHPLWLAWVEATRNEALKAALAAVPSSLVSRAAADREP